MTRDKTLVLFNYDWDAIAFGRLSRRWPQLRSGFDLHNSPSNTRLAWFDIDRFSSLASIRARLSGARAVVSNHDQFGALCSALVAEKLGWPGTPVEAVLACQHKLYAREVLQRVAPEANVPFRRLEADYNGPIPPGLPYPTFVKPVKASFSVLARQVDSHEELVEHTRFGPWELWVIRHLVEPFERIARRRLPAAGTAHRLILEAPQRGRQYCLDGYFFDGAYRRLGVTDAVMYPGTESFMRFEYPSHLPESVQHEADRVARRFLQEIGFTHGMFNMEFVHDPQTGRVKVIEFNPRMAAQFSDLYARVDGIDLHEMVLALSHGIDPATLPTREPTAGCAASFVYRSFNPAAEINMPPTAAVGRFNAAFPDGLLLQFPKLPCQIQRDFKWLDSYRYGIMHLGGRDSADLRIRCERASMLLGWPSPYVQDAAHLPGLVEGAQPWPADVGTERAPG